MKKLLLMPLIITVVCAVFYNTAQADATADIPMSMLIISNATVQLVRPNGDYITFKKSDKPHKFLCEATLTGSATKKQYTIPESELTFYLVKPGGEKVGPFKFWFKIETFFHSKWMLNTGSRSPEPVKAKGGSASWWFIMDGRPKSSIDVNPKAGSVSLAMRLYINLD